MKEDPWIIQFSLLLQPHCRMKIEGLTTAAAILICCTIDITAALEQLILAGGVTFLTVIHTSFSGGAGAKNGDQK